MWKKLWTWVGANAPTLQGIAALVFIVGAIAATPAVLARIFRPDINVTVDLERGSIPNELIEFFHTLSWRVPDRIVDLLNQYPELKDILSSPTLERVNALGSNFSSLLIEVQNQRDRTISGVRLRADRVSDVWDVRVSGTFLTKKEAAAFVSQIPAERSSTLVLPELPPLPPKSSLFLQIRGAIDYPEVAVSAQGVSYNIQTMDKLRHTWLLWLYKNPFMLVTILPVAIMIFVAIAGEISGRIQRKALLQGVPSVFYNAACKKAKEGELDEAMVLLRSAFDQGYKNIAHVKADEDFQSLRKRKDFQKLVGEG